MAAGWQNAARMQMLLSHTRWAAKPARGPGLDVHPGGHQDCGCCGLRTEGRERRAVGEGDERQKAGI